MRGCYFPNRASPQPSCSNLTTARLYHLQKCQLTDILHHIVLNFLVTGESLLMALKDVALSSGSACTSASLEPSYVLRAIGADEDLAHSSIRWALNIYYYIFLIKPMLAMIFV